MKARYTGKNGAHYMGVPDRDLNDDDWARLTDEQKANVRAGVIYEVIEDDDDGDKSDEEKVEERVAKDQLSSAAAAAASAVKAPTAHVAPAAPADEGDDKSKAKGGGASKP